VLKICLIFNCLALCLEGPLSSLLFLFVSIFFDGQIGLEDVLLTGCFFLY
jgi:hypothetical protein